MVKSNVAVKVIKRKADTFANFLKSVNLDEWPFRIAAVVREITPEDARHILENLNKKNRPIARRQVDQYVLDMKAGDWKKSTDAIGFDEKGQLINGQHRLTALIETGATIVAIIAIGFEKDVLAILDSGKGRTIGDQLYMYQDVPNDRKQMTGQTLHFFAALITGAQYRRMSALGGHGLHHIISRKQTQDLLISYPQIRESVDFVKTLVGKKGFKHWYGMAAYLHYCGTHLLNRQALVEKFITDVMLGTDLSEESPAFQLRRFFSSEKKQQEGLPQIQNNLSIIAWNFTLAADEVGIGNLSQPFDLGVALKYLTRTTKKSGPPKPPKMLGLEKVGTRDNHGVTPEWPLSLSETWATLLAE